MVAVLTLPSRTTVNAFGRLVAPSDGRDFGYLMRAAVPQIVKAVGKPKPRTRPYNMGPILDQGDTPQCVGYACRAFLDAAPIMSKATEGPSATALYHLAQTLDEWPNENYNGTSTRGGMKALEQTGQIGSYVWAKSLDDAIAWMNGGHGVIIVGTNWYAEMSDVDSKGFMREPPNSLSTPIGGHEWVWNWYDAKRQGILMRQSWGPGFGWQVKGRPGLLSGSAYLRRELAEKLLREDGDAVGPVQIKLKRMAIAA